MFIYTGNYIESHKNIQNIIIWPKTHQLHENTFPNFIIVQFLKIHIFQKLDVQHKSAFYDDFYGNINIVEGQTF